MAEAGLDESRGGSELRKKALLTLQGKSMGTSQVNGPGTSGFAVLLTVTLAGSPSQNGTPSGA